MKAVIIAGGEGTRLRPLTEYLPKPLVRLCGRPILAYLLDWLLENGFDDCVLALGHRGEQIRAYCDAHPLPMRIAYSQEDTPLGTAGAVRHALHENVPTLVLSADALCDFSLREAVQRHGERGALATVLTTRLDDPREYGAVLAAQDGRVTALVEKPAYSQVADTLVSTGIYLLSAQAVERLPAQGDFAFDFFPALLQENEPLYTDTLPGYWCDVGDPDAYRKAGRDLLAGRVGHIHGCTPPHGNFILREPVYLGENVRIGDGAVVGPWSILEAGCSVGAGAQATGSVLLGGAGLGENASACDCILCDDAQAHDNTRLSDCILGERVIVGADSRVLPLVALPGESRVAPNTTASDARPFPVFDESGISGLLESSFSPALALEIGAALGTIATRPVALAWDGGSAARVLADALKCGILSSGTAVMDFGQAFPALFRYGVCCNGLDFGVHLCAEKEVTVRFVEQGGLPAGRHLERALEHCLRQKNSHTAKADCFGQARDLRAFSKFYASQLLACAPQGLEGLSATVHCENQQASALLTKALTDLGCQIDRGGIQLLLSPDAQHLSLRQGEAFLDAYATVAAYAQTHFQLGEAVAVENSFPRALDAFAEKWDCAVLRYFSCPAGNSDAAARALAARQCTGDALRLALTLLAELKRRACSLRTLQSELPAFFTAQETIPISLPPGKLLPLIAGTSTGEGILQSHPGRGSVLVRPAKDGRALRLFAEAASWETAQELCAALTEKVRAYMQSEAPPPN